MEPPDKIVVVDDDVDIARFVEVNLKLQGYDVLLAHDGEAALHLITTHEPALAIVDWMMPKLDGLELIRQLRADPMTAPLPVICGSSMSRPPVDDDNPAGRWIGALPQATSATTWTRLRACCAMARRHASNVASLGL